MLLFWFWWYQWHWYFVFQLTSKFKLGVVVLTDSPLNISLSFCVSSPPPLYIIIYRMIAVVRHAFFTEIDTKGPCWFGHFIKSLTLYFVRFPILINWQNSQIPECTCSISHNAAFRTKIQTYPTMFHSEQKSDHFSSEWSIMGYGTDAFLGLWNWSVEFSKTQLCGTIRHWYLDSVGVNARSVCFISAVMRLHLFVNTLGPRQHRRRFADDIFKCIFFN